MIIEVLAIMLGAAHFGIPVAYYSLMKSYLARPWNLSRDQDYRPRVSIIVPTYNEESFIQTKLSDLLLQTYPRELLDIIVVDDGSQDATPERVEEWRKQHPELYVKFFRKPANQGKLFALGLALKHLDEHSGILVVTDADALWDHDALHNAMSYFADAVVGCVTCSIFYPKSMTAFSEDDYRSYYNALRVSESKRYSTPILNGPFLAIRVNIIREKGLPDYLGSDDSVFGSFIAFMGYRSIQADDVKVVEPVRGNRFRTKVRRGNRLLLNFLNTKRYARNLGVYVRSPFEETWKMEWWLHIVNPWFLVGSITLLTYAVLFSGSIIALALLGLACILMIAKLYRTWVSQQVYLLAASLRNLWTRDVRWSR